MADDKSWWQDESAQFWAKFGLGAVALVGAAIAWFTLDRPASVADAELKAAQAINEKLASQLQAATLQVDAARRTAQLRETAANAQRAEFEAAKSSKPRLVITPGVYQTASVDDIREIALEVDLKNVGMTNVEIKLITVEVSEAAPSRDATEAIRRTIRLAPRLQAYLQQYVAGPTDATMNERARADLLDEKRDAFTAGWQAIEQNCPHGQLFAISEASHDVTWKRLDRLTESIASSTTLLPDASVSRKFLYLLTEYPNQHHRQWFRFRITVNTGSATAHTFEQVVSGLPLPGSKEVSYTTAKPYYQPYYWKADSPLIEVPTPEDDAVAAPKPLGPEPSTQPPRP